MIKILSLCIHLLLLTISDAVPLKLVAGDRSVVKKDGVTHTISKYYVVPNDYDPNNVTNTTDATQKTTYSETIASGSISENISESKATTVNDREDSEVTVKKNNTIIWGSDLKVGQGEVTNQPHNSTESTVSMGMGQTLDSDDLGNLQVEPIINPVNISRIDTDKDTDVIVNSGEAVQKGSAFFVENVTDYQKQQTVVQNFENNILEDLILSKIGIAVHETYSQNLESFWKLIKINIDKQLSEDVLLANIEKLTLLLNIFTNLYQAVQLKQPVEKVTEAIVEILTPPFIEKRNGVKSKAETSISGDYDEECMSKCGQRSFKPQLNSKGTLLSETDGKASELKLEKLERTDKAVSGDTNILNSIESVKNLNVQPVTFESRFADVLPITIKPRATVDLPWTIDDSKTEFPSTNLTTQNDGLPWHIENYKSNTQLPVTIEQRTNNKLSWNIVSKTDHQPVKTTVFGVRNGIKKPYHMYTYVINPTTTLYKVPNAGNVIQVVSRQPHHENLETTLYGLPTLHGGNKIVYKDQLPQSYYESTKDISSQPSYSQVTQTNDVTTVLDPSHELSPSTIDSRTLQEANELQYLVGDRSEPNHEPAVLQSNTRETLSVPEIDSPPGDLLVSGYSNPFESRTSLDRPNTASVSRVSVTSSVNPDIDNLLINPNSYYLNDNGNRIQKISYPAWVSKVSDHSSIHTTQHPELISSSASSSAYTNRLEGSVYRGQIYDNNVPILVDKGDTNNYSGYISKASAYSEYANVPIDYGHNINTQHGLSSEVKQYPINPNVVNDLDDSILVDGVQIQKNPSYTSEASAHSELTIPVNYNVPTHDYVNEIDSNPVNIQNVPNYPEYTNEVNRYIKVKAVNGGSAQNYLVPNQPMQDEDKYLVPQQPTQNEDNYLVPNQPTQDVDKYLVPYQPYEHKVHVNHRPSLNEIISGNQNLRQKLAPTYRLFTPQNLQNLKNAVMKTLQIYGAGVYDHRALINLKNIISAILAFANLEGTEGTNAWYEKMFYKSEDSQQPLQLYVYNLIRQRWLHELMLLLYRNNFSINILIQTPSIFSFLESWQFPEYIKNVVEVEELKHDPKPQNFNDLSYNQNDLQYKVSTHTYDNILLKEVPVDLGKYVTKNVVDSYKTLNEGTVLDIGGVKAEPNAKAIVEIVQNYLHNKNFIETQENVIIDDNKVEMMKQITSFLRMQGYSHSIIANLIRKLYAAVYSTEGTGCQTQNINFAKNIYDVIVAVLRRSGQ